MEGYARARGQLPPELAGLSPDILMGAINAANLGRMDTVIATQRMIDQIPFADIGAEVGYDRSTIGKHYNRHIVPSVIRSVQWKQ